MQQKYQEIIWFLRGSQRKKLFLNLPEKEFMPNKLRKNLKTKMSLREMSRHLKNFKERKYLRCLNENDSYNKIYLLTEKGKTIKKQLKEF